jgi:hypothetical protein
VLKRSVKTQVCKYDLGLLVHGKFWIVTCLNRLVDDAVNYAQRVEIERVALHAAILNPQVLVIEVVEERGSVMTTIRLSEEVEILWCADLGIELGNRVQQGLENVLQIISFCP